MGLVAGKAQAFLSTLSLRRATSSRPKTIRRSKYFYPRSPCGERPASPLALFSSFCISIHALLAESDHSVPCVVSKCGKFLSTLSLRRATPCPAIRCPHACHFYPRSPCGERRRSHCHSCGCRTNFYPRSPCGERPSSLSNFRTSFPFLSTLSLRRATIYWRQAVRL